MQEMQLTTHISVDGIPVGTNYGIAIEREEPSRTNFFGRFDGSVREWKMDKQFRVYLTERDGCGIYRTVREIPPDAYVVARGTTETIEVHNGIVTIKRKAPR